MAAIRSLRSAPSSDPWRATDGWRLAGRAPLTIRVETAGATAMVTVQRTAAGWLVAIDDRQPFEIGVELHDDEVVATVDGVSRRYAVVDDGAQTWIGAGGAAWALRVRHRWPSERAGVAVEADGLLTSPMPGKVLEVRVAVGDVVAAGQTLATVEAMKMEHPLISGIDGIVAEVHVRPGQPVALGDAVVRVAPAAPPGSATS